MPEKKYKHKKGVNIQPRLLTVAEGAVFLGRTVTAIRELIWKGTLPYVKWDRRYFLDIRDLEKFIEQHKTRFTY